MKVLIIGPLGAGKSTLAYQLNKKFNLSRLNLDEVCRIKENGKYRTQREQTALIRKFLMTHPAWVVAIFRFTKRFFKARKLIGKEIPPDLPVQAYHYRPITLSKIRDWDKTNRAINTQIGSFLKTTSIPVICCRGYKDYAKVFQYLKKSNL